MNSSTKVAAIATAIAVAAGTLVSGAGADPKDGGSDSGVVFRAERGISRAYHIAGTPGRDTFKVNISPTGRFVLRSEQPLTPITPPNGCRVDSTFQVSCDPGLVSRVFSRLKRGRDKFIAGDRFRLNARILGGLGPDRILGGNKADTLRGGGGPDRLVGARGDDALYGRPGRDLIDGGSGDDLIAGGRGHDIIDGGPGHDDVTQ